MANFNNVLSRSGTAALVPEDVSKAMLGRVATEPNGSSALRIFKNIPVSGNQTRFPILSALPIAYFVNGDTGLAQSTEVAWSNKFLNVEPLAVYVPVPSNVLDDVQDGGFDLWSEVTPAVEEALSRTIDQAIFFGNGAPSVWPENILADSVARGFDYQEQSTADEGGIQNDIDTLIAQLEQVGFSPSHIVSNLTLKGKLREARSTVGERLTGVSPAIDEYLDLSIEYPMRGLWPSQAPGDVVEAFVGDFSEFVIGVRQDVEAKVLDQALIQDNTGAIVYNLPQQDMVAIRFTMRLGWQVSNQIRYDQPTEADRYPVGSLMTPNTTTP